MREDLQKISKALETQKSYLIQVSELFFQDQQFELY